MVFAYQSLAPGTGVSPGRKEEAHAVGDPAGAENQAEPRVIRVFISSTFRDMQAERDELVKRTFPALRKLCESRGVTWGEVDLRWGVTDEQRSEGKVLPLCLEEIHRCRPYFIGLLGERYGWVPDAIPQELIDREPWLVEHPEHSVTELEILHGVLNDPKMADRAFFYFRDPAYINTLTAGQQAAYREVPPPEEVARYGESEAQRRAQERQDRLTALKERIRGSGLLVRENYPDPQALAAWVLADMTTIIDRLYPEGSQPDPLDREVAEHEAFAHSRAVIQVSPEREDGVYIGRQEYFDSLDAHADGDGPPLVVLGESGSGQVRSPGELGDAIPGEISRSEDEPAALVLIHFIGATPYSTDWAAMLRRIMGEFKRRLSIKGDIPDQSDALRAAFANWLHMAAAKGRVVLILDGLNQLEDRDGAPDLVWLPPVIPANVRLIVSTLPGRPLDDLRKRDWPTLDVQPLNAGEREQLITLYLAQYGKTLSQPQAQRVAAVPQTANPLYLRALLEELRVFGIHEQIDERIGHYLAAGTIDGFYEKILARYEEDYQRERPGLVGEAMALLWAARRGLSEAEVLDLLGEEGAPLPRAYWSPLHLAAESGLVNRSGLIGFFHDYLRQAVQHRYLPDAGVQRGTRLRLADYFERRGLDSRQVDELPWLLAQAEEWPRLYDRLADLDFFSAVWVKDPFEVKTYWAQVEANSTLRKEEAYRSVLESPQVNQEILWRLSSLLADTGKSEEALALRSHLAKRFRQVGDTGNLARARGNQALILYARGDLDGALTLWTEQEHHCRQLGDLAGVSMSFGNRAMILRDRGNLDAALALLKKQARICRQLGDLVGLKASLNNQGLILRDRGDLDGALLLWKETERISRQLGDLAGLSMSLGNQALILQARGNLDGALALHKEEERICRQLGDLDGLRSSLATQGVILYDRGDLEGALALWKEGERISRQLGNLDSLQVRLATRRWF